MQRIAFFCLVSLALVGCGNDHSGLISGVQGKQLVLKASSGEYRVVPIEEVQAVEITVRTLTPSGYDSYSRTFQGADAVRVVAKLGLHKPTEPGSLACLRTGDVSLTLANETRQFGIEDHCYLEDDAHQEVYYATSGNIDHDWLQQQ